MTDRKKPGWKFWATVVLVVVPALYVLSFGPAMWIFWKDWRPTWYPNALRIVYAPLFRIKAHGPEPIRLALIWYGDLFH